jgi:hypothetical protein
MSGPVGVVRRCDLCGEPVENPYRLRRFQGRMPRVCGNCLVKIARAVAQIERLRSAA